MSYLYLSNLVHSARAKRESVASNPILWLAGAALFTLLLISFSSTMMLAIDPFQHGDLLMDRYKPPSYEHLFGTDKFGRDVLARTLYGARISLLIAIGVVLVAFFIGTLYGLISGYAGGWLDQGMMYVLDFLLAFPAIFLLMFLLAMFQMNHWWLIPILGLTGWMETARLVRAEVLTVKERDFMHAAIGLGLSRWRIISRHILPNVLTSVLITIPFKVADVILLESALSFLGLGVQPPIPSWGNLINDGRSVLLSAWWISTAPALFILFTTLIFNVIGDRLRKQL
ncbi:MAG: ABC transporter permease [Calditrichia bacterium]